MGKSREKLPMKDAEIMSSCRQEDSSRPRCWLWLIHAGVQLLARWPQAHSPAWEPGVGPQNSTHISLCRRPNSNHFHKHPLVFPLVLFKFIFNFEQVGACSFSRDPSSPAVSTGRSFPTPKWQVFSWGQDVLADRGICLTAVTAWQGPTPESPPLTASSLRHSPAPTLQLGESDRWLGTGREHRFPAQSWFQH